MRLRNLLWPLLGFILGCASQFHGPPYDTRFQRTPSPVLHPMVKPTEPDDAWYPIQQSSLRPLSQAVSPAYWLDQAVGGPEALDINDFDEVIDSPWFENRLSRGMTVQEVAHGPTGRGPPQGYFLYVESGKFSGASPGLRVRDERGVRYLVKFDPPGYPGLASAAELVTTRVLYAAGYNVPENYVLRFRARRLVIVPGATGPGEGGHRVPLTEDTLQDLVTLANPTLDGTVTALFSRILDGTVAGPFAYEGTRPDDPNDRIPHERRRSLRALRWFAAWTNNADMRASNTLDMFVDEAGSGQGFLKHYLIDFGDALGSGGTEPKHFGDGYEPVLSWPALAETFFSAGLRYKYWLPVNRSRFRSVGLFEAKVFEPKRWSPYLQNPAFDAVTHRDTFWAGTILAKFDRSMVDAVVAEAHLSDPEAARAIADTLWARRQKILEYSLSLAAPLGEPRVVGMQLHLCDLAIESGIADASKVSYAALGDQGQPLPVVVNNALVSIDLEGFAGSTVKVTRRLGTSEASLTVRIVGSSGRFYVVGLQR